MQAGAAEATTHIGHRAGAVEGRQYADAIDEEQWHRVLCPAQSDRRQ
jgi:hypothetical protein